MYKSWNKIASKFVENLLKYRIMFKVILTFLGLDYRDASLIISFFDFLGISIPQIRPIGWLYIIKVNVKKS